MTLEITTIPFDPSSAIRLATSRFLHACRAPWLATPIPVSFATSNSTSRCTCQRACLYPKHPTSSLRPQQGPISLCCWVFLWLCDDWLNRRLLIPALSCTSSVWVYTWGFVHCSFFLLLADRIFCFARNFDYCHFCISDPINVFQIFRSWKH